MDDRRVKLAFGQELRKARTDVGLSQEKLALSVGLDRTYISLLERGLRQPSLTTILTLSPALGLTSVKIVERVVKNLNAAYDDD